MLVLQKSDQESYNLFTKGEHLIGRQGDVQLSDDRSVSRQHAVIRISLKNGEAVATLQDLGSTTGTYVNDSSSRLSPTATVVLKICDKIKFGVLQNIWTLTEKPFVVCVSKLSREDKVALKRQLLAVKGTLVTDWSDECTHLTMNHFDTTVKAMCALVQAKPVVTLTYWENLAKVFGNRRETLLPCCDDFAPKALDDWLKKPDISFKLNFSRKNLFTGLKFIVFDVEKLETLRKMVESAGGEIIDGFSQKVSAEEIRQKKAILIQPVIETNNRSLISLRKVLNTHRLRPINDSEIFLSIIRCSLDKYCNPSFDMASVLQMSESQTHVSENNATILAAETQDSLTLADTQYSETGSGNFSLTINGAIVNSDSENEIVSDTEPMTISDSGDESKIIGRCAVKRKSETPKEKSSYNAKNRKIDYWLLRTSQQTDVDPNSKLAVDNTDNSRVENFSCDVKKEVIDLASRTKTETSHPSSLFGSMNARKTRSNNSTSMFNTSSNQKSLFDFVSKRKVTDTIDGTSPSKKNCPLMLKLESDTSGSRKREATVVLDSPDNDSSCDSFTKKLRVSESSDFPCSQVHISKPMSLSEFTDVTVLGTRLSDQVKKESGLNELESSSSQIVHKPVVKVESLIKYLTAPDSIQQTYTNNFKKFRKSHVCYPASE